MAAAKKVLAPSRFRRAKSLAERAPTPLILVGFEDVLKIA
jgi:hypothetical protein